MNSTHEEQPDFSSPADDPESRFGSPRELEASPKLSLDQKRNAIKTWRSTVKQRLAAASEGMTEHPEGSLSDDAKLLSEIDRVAQRLC